MDQIVFLEYFASADDVHIIFSLLTIADNRWLVCEVLQLHRQVNAWVTCRL